MFQSQFLSQVLIKYQLATLLALRTFVGFSDSVHLARAAVVKFDAGFAIFDRF
jgi:hypothetical protein